MAAINATFNAVIIDLYGRVISGPVKIVGELMYSDRGVGGGPVFPPAGGGGGSPDRPVDPGYGYPEKPVDPGYGVPDTPRPIDPPEVPPGAENGDLVKPPPANGGWGFTAGYGWSWFPGPGQAGPKA